MGSLKTGAFRHRVLLRRPTGQHDALGEPTQGAWEVYAAPWANILTPTGAAQTRASDEINVVRASVRLRWRTDVQAGHQVVHGTTVYQVLSVLPDEQSRQTIDLACEVRP